MNWKIYLTAALLLSACGETEKDVIEGRYMYTTSVDGMFQLFVEDSYTQTSYRYLNDLHYDLPDNYEAEAYLIEVNEETIFTEPEGEEIHSGESNFPFHWPNQRIEVTVNEPFTSLSQPRDEPLTKDSRMLPVYTASEIVTYPYRSEDFIEVHTPVEKENYMLFIFDENFNRDYLYILQEFAVQIEQRYDTYLSVLFYHPDYFEEFMEIEQFPSYLMLNKEGEVLRTAEWEEVRSFFAEETDVSMPIEGDPAWLDMLYER